MIHDESVVPPEFARLFDAERARVLRHRALWYCFVAMALLALSIGQAAIDLLDMPWEQWRRESLLEFIGDWITVGLHVAAVVLLLGRSPPTRARVVTIVSWLIFLTSAVVMLYTPLVDNSTVLAGARPEPTDDAALAQGLVTLFAVLVMHALATILVNLSPREGLRPLAPMLGLFVVSVLLLLRGASPQTRLLLIALSPLAGLPGFLISWWMHRSFSERFQARLLARRYHEVTRDLADARRVHEALFPPPVTRGPVRVHYRYEPARQIGGDFLFIHPLAFPPSANLGALSVVVIDVTGHGVPAALTVNRLHGELQRVFQSSPGIAPGEVIANLNAFASANLSPQAQFATALCVRVEPVARGRARVQWASAGHPDGLIRRRDGSLSMLTSTACMLGVLPADAFSSQPRTTTLESGETLIALTDGVAEAKDLSGAEFGAGRIAAAVRHASGPGAITDGLMSALGVWCQDPPADDTLIVEITLADSNESAAGT